MSILWLHVALTTTYYLFFRLCVFGGIPSVCGWVTYFVHCPSGFIRLYEAMILRGDRDAIWRFYVFENNLMEEDPAVRLLVSRLAVGIRTANSLISLGYVAAST